MLTEECGLNPYLEARGIEVVDTDLGERIVQLRGEGPSHIVMPAIHLRKEEVGDTFHEQLGTPAGLADPNALADAAREHLRERFLAADCTLTGMNFAIAETGGFVVCTNEGNADLGMALAPIHIASVGIEKIIPRVEDLGVFLRLLARSATGQAVTAYTLAHPRAARGAGAARRAGGQRPHAPARARGVLALAQVHPLRRVHEHLPDLPALGRTQLRLDRAGPDRQRADARARSRALRVAAVRVHAVRVVHGGVSGEDRPRRAALPLAAARRRERATCRARSASRSTASVRRVRSTAALSRRGRAGAARAAAPSGAARAPRRGAVGTHARGAGAARRRASARGIASIAEDPRERRASRARARRSSPRCAQARPPAVARPEAPRPAPDVGGRPARALDAFTAAAIAAGADGDACARATTSRAWSTRRSTARARCCRSPTGVPSHDAPRGRPARARRSRRARLRADARRRREWRGVDRDRRTIGCARRCFSRRAWWSSSRETDLVDDLHDAYARIDVRRTPFGAFVAGPSKTADIEQSLVIGAHGPKAFSIVVVRAMRRRDFLRFTGAGLALGTHRRVRSRRARDDARRARPRATRAEPVDRRARLARHSPVVRVFDSFSALSVGNGGFAFTADATGLQTFPERVPRAAARDAGGVGMAQRSRTSAGYKLEDALVLVRRARPTGAVRERAERTRGHLAARESASPLARARRLRAASTPTARRRKPSDLTDVEQRLDLWTGTLDSRFTLDGRAVRVLHVGASGARPDRRARGEHRAGSVAARRARRVSRSRARRTPAIPPTGRTPTRHRTMSSTAIVAR